MITLRCVYSLPHLREARKALEGGDPWEVLGIFQQLHKNKITNTLRLLQFKMIVGKVHFVKERQ
jgi:preprotein translocase subunit Sec63